MRERWWRSGSFPCTVFFVVLFMALSCPFSGDSQAQTSADEYISSGEDALFSKTVDSILQAHSTFEAAHTAYPNDPVINAYLALTRLLDLALREDGTGLTGLLSQYGITRTGTDLATLAFDPSILYDEYPVVPEDAPSGEAIRAFISDTLMPDIDASITNLDTTVAQWTDPNSKHVIPKEKLDEYMDMEFDLGDVYLLRAALKFMKAFSLIITAYDLDVDVREILSLINMDFFNVKDFLDRYPDFLNLLTISSTPSVEGAARLALARTALMGAIDDYLTASDKIRNDPGTEFGAEELIAIEPCDLQAEEFFRLNLSGLRDSLDQGTAFQFVEEEETWLITDGSTGKRLEAHLWENNSEGFFQGLDGCDFIGCGGEIECVEIDGDQITLTLSSYGSEVTFTGTLNQAGDQITSGSYSGWTWQGNVSGSFTATRTNVTSETTSLDLNPLFGNGAGPYDLRDFLPDFNCDGEPVSGSMGHGLGDDPTLGGILPNMTQEDWGLEGISASGEVLIPQATINVQDNSLADWGSIAPVFQDVIGDEDLDYQGGDIQDLYLAKDDDFLYGRITLADGPPNQNTQSNPWQAMGYFVQFQPRPAMFPGGVTVQVDFLDGNWRIQVWEGQEGYQSNMLATYNTGYAQAVGNDLEWKVPLADLGSITGRFLATWTQWIPYMPEPIDNNETCLQIGPLSSISGTLNVPAYDGTGPIYIGVYRAVNGEFINDRQYLLGMEIIDSGDYTAGMGYIVGGLPVGEEVYVVAMWDADFNGLRTRGDYLTKIGPLTVAGDGSTVANLKPRIVYARDEATPYFRGCNVQALNTTGGVMTSLTALVEDPNGSLPESIVSLTVTGPGGFSYSFTGQDFIGAPFNVYWHGIQGQPGVGEYTFTVTDDEGKTATSHYYFPGGTNIPLPDQSTLQASGDPLQPTLSWAAVTDYQGNLFYRARIFDPSDYSIVWTSDFTPFTAVQVPGGILQQGVQYKWRVEAFDNYHYFASNQRANSGMADFIIHNSTPYFNFATIFHRKDSNGDWTQIEVSVVDPDGSVPSSINALEVYDPQDSLVYAF
ncbi:MAG: hypothetical protein JRH06_16430, partial [Deltaproteobacteria bacterium]|nr:hypothetical protein [Deltaproteobacteria bacterium]